MGRQKREIPHSVINRLTEYLAHLQVLKIAGVKWVASGELALALGLTGSTVRQDMSHVNFSGISKRGYEVEGLERELVDILGADTSWNLAVVGAGNIGRALALHEEFGRRGFQICAIFDSDPKKQGRKIGRLTVEPLERVPELIRKLKISIGVIAVPAVSAQSVANLLIAAGVKGLLNLALTHIAAPKHVPVTDARMVSSLLELAFAIKSTQRARGRD